MPTKRCPSNHVKVQCKIPPLQDRRPPQILQCDSRKMIFASAACSASVMAFVPSTCQRGGFLCLFQSSRCPPAHPLYLCEKGQLGHHICGWVGGTSSSIPVPCWDSTAARPLFEKLNLSSRWNISSCQSQPRHLESMCLSPELLHITIRCIATAL